MKPTRFEKLVILVSIAVLLGTTPFLVFEQLYDLAQVQMLAKLWAVRLHGFFAIVFVLGIGSLSRIHIPVGWRVEGRRLTGLICLALSTILILTGYWLYYGTEEFFRETFRQAHIVAGLILPLALLFHAKYNRCVD